MSREPNQEPNQEAGVTRLLALADQHTDQHTDHVEERGDAEEAAPREVPGRRGAGLPLLVTAPVVTPPRPTVSSAHLRLSTAHLPAPPVVARSPQPDAQHALRTGANDAGATRLPSWPVAQDPHTTPAFPATGAPQPGRWRRLMRAAAHPLVRGQRTQTRYALRRGLRQTWLPVGVTTLCASVTLLVILWGPQLLTPVARPALSSSAWQSGASAGATGGGAAPGTPVPASAGGPATPNANAPTPTLPPSAQPTATPGGGVSPAPEWPWPPRDPWANTADGHHAVWVRSCWDFSGAWRDAADWCHLLGWCTWGAAALQPEEDLRWMGDARYWAQSAQRRGYPVGTRPQVGATVVFAPGVEGAGGAGHVAHVVAVFPSGWFEVQEMNFSWHRGGWQTWDWRYAYVTWGVQFIY